MGAQKSSGCHFNSVLLMNHKIACDKEIRTCKPKDKEVLKCPRFSESKLFLPEQESKFALSRVVPNLKNCSFAVLKEYWYRLC